MTHGFSEETWIKWSEGTLDAPSRHRMEEHVTACAECARMQTEMRLWRERLAEEGAKLRSALTLPEPEISRMLAESLERVQQPDYRAAEGLAFLRALLAPVLGAGAIRAAIDRSVLRAAPNGMSSRLWAAFTAEFKQTIEAIHGVAAGRLAAGAALSLTIRDA